MRCPFCWVRVDLDKLPVVATNYVGASEVDSPVSPAGFDDDSLGFHLEGGQPEPPSAVTVQAGDGGAVGVNRPASGAPSYGQIGPYPILHDPDAPAARKTIWGSDAKFDRKDAPARACRDCEMAIDAELSSAKVTTIGVVGNQYAGKSHFLTAACYEMMRRQRLRQLGLGEVEPVLETGAQFHSQRFRPVYQDRTVLPRTTTAEGMEAYRRPLALRLDPPESASRVLMFHDVPGEWLADRNRRLRHFEFLNHLDALIFIIDPMGIPAVRRQLEGSVDPAHFHDDLVPQDLLIGEIARQVGAERAAKMPVSAVIAKSDMVVRAFGPLAELERPEPTDGDQMRAEIRELHDLVRTKVLPWLDEPALEAAVAKFPRAVWHLVAPLGTLPDVDLRISGELRPSRVIDPVFRVLYELPQVARPGRGFFG